MVIDFHVHPLHWQEVTSGFEHYLHGSWSAEELESLRRQCETGGGLAAYLKSQGVDYGVVLAEQTPTTGMVDNEAVIEMCAGQEALIPFGTVYPALHYDLPAYLGELVAKGIRGIKLYPTYNLFYPNDSVLYPFYAKAEQLGIPIMVHTGTSVFPGSRIKYGDPLLLDDVAVDFPELRILLSHAGRPFWHSQAEFLARLHKNVYLDIAGLPPKNLLRYLPNTQRLTQKMVFGSDWPGIRSIAQNIADIRALPLPAEGTERILASNAAAILGL